MKYILILLLVIFSATCTRAQKHHLYADLGVSGTRLYPGISATYNYRPVRHLGVGAGLQVYDIYPGITYAGRYVSAAYGDLRFNIRPRKKNQFFLFLDMGMNFYRGSGARRSIGAVVYTDNDDNGMYTGFGAGYLLRIAKRGWGLYTSAKVISNSYEADAYNTVTQERYVDKGGRGTLVLSFGFKF